MESTSNQHGHCSRKTSQHRGTMPFRFVYRTADISHLLSHRKLDSAEISAVRYTCVNGPQIVINTILFYFNFFDRYLLSFEFFSELYIGTFKLKIQFFNYKYVRKKSISLFFGNSKSKMVKAGYRILYLELEFEFTYSPFHINGSFVLI